MNDTPKSNTDRIVTAVDDVGGEQTEGFAALFVQLGAVASLDAIYQVAVECEKHLGAIRESS